MGNREGGGREGGYQVNIITGWRLPPPQKEQAFILTEREKVLEKRHVCQTPVSCYTL